MRPMPTCHMSFTQRQGLNQGPAWALAQRINRHDVDPGVMCTPVILTLGKLRQEKQKLEASPSYTASQGQLWLLRVTLSQNKQKQK